MFTIVPTDIAWALKADYAVPPVTIDVNKITIPQNLASIKDAWQASDPKKIVIHIQDAHCNYYAQTKITEIIDYLNKTYGIAQVNLEGGKGDYDLSAFTDINDQGKRAAASEHFVKEGVINGAESFAVNNPDKISLWGIEDTKLYIENLRVYRESLAYKGDIEKYLNNINYYLSNLKIKIYSKELLELDRKETAYKEKSVDLKDYLVYLVNLSKYYNIDISALKNIAILNKAVLLESGIDFKKSNLERDALIDRLTKELSRIEVKELVEKAVAFKLGQVTPSEFYSYLTNKAKELRINMDEYKNLILYIGYTRFYSTLKNDELFKELDGLKDKIREKLYQNDEQKELHSLSKNLAIIKNIFGITLTPDEYRYYVGHRDEFRVENYMKFVNRKAPLHGFNFQLDNDTVKLNNYLDSMAKFYEYSSKRDKAFLKNMKFGSEKSRDAAIIVTGGFHSENLAQNFKNNNISYISIVPNFKSEDGYTCPYFKLLSGEKRIVLAKEVQQLTGQALAYCSPNTVLAEKVAAELPTGHIKEPSPVVAPSAAEAATPLAGAASSGPSPELLERIGSAENLDSVTWDEILEILSHPDNIRCTEIPGVDELPDIYLVELMSTETILKFVIYTHVSRPKGSMAVFKVDRAENVISKDKVIDWESRKSSEYAIVDKAANLLSAQIKLQESKGDDSTTFALASPLVFLVGHLFMESASALGAIFEIAGLALTLGFVAYITHHYIAKWRSAKPPASKVSNLFINRILTSDVNDALVRELAVIEEKSFSDNPALILGRERISASLLSEGGINIIARNSDGNAVGYMLSRPATDLDGLSFPINPETLYGTDLAILPGYRDKPAVPMLRMFRAFTQEATRAGYRYFAFHARRVSGVSDFFQRMGAEKMGEEANRWNSGETFDILRLDLSKLPHSFIMPSVGVKLYAKAAPVIALTAGILSGSDLLIGLGILMPAIPLILRTIRDIYKQTIKRLAKPAIMAGFAYLFYRLGTPAMLVVLKGEPTTLNLVNGLFSVTMLMIATAIAAKGLADFLMPDTARNKEGMGINSAGEGYTPRRGFLNFIYSMTVYGLAAGLIKAMDKADKPWRYAASINDRTKCSNRLITFYNKLRHATIRFVSPKRMAEICEKEGFKDIRGITGLTVDRGGRVYVSVAGLGKDEMGLAEFTSEVLINPSVNENMRRHALDTAYHEGVHAHIAPSRPKGIISGIPLAPLFNVLRRRAGKLDDWTETGKKFLSSVFGEKDAECIRKKEKVPGTNTAAINYRNMFDTLRRYPVYASSSIPYEETVAYILGTMEGATGILDLPEADAQLEEYRVLNGYKNETDLHRLAGIFLQSLSKKQFEGLVGYYREKFGIEPKVPKFLWNKFYWQVGNENTSHVSQIGKRARGEITPDKKLKVTDSKGATRTIDLFAEGNVNIPALMSQIGSADDIKSKYKKIILDILKLHESSPPQLYLFTELIEDLFGVASNGAIAILDFASRNRIVLFHELTHLLIDKGLVSLELIQSNDNSYIEIKTRKAIDEQFSNPQRVEISDPALIIARKNYSDSHYLLRALQREIFNESDRELTFNIKNAQLAEDLLRGENFNMSFDEKLFLVTNMEMIAACVMKKLLSHQTHKVIPQPINTAIKAEAKKFGLDKKAVNRLLNFIEYKILKSPDKFCPLLAQPIAQYYYRYYYYPVRNADEPVFDLDTYPRFDFGKTDSVRRALLGSGVEQGIDWITEAPDTSDIVIVDNNRLICDILTEFKKMVGKDNINVLRADITDENFVTSNNLSSRFDLIVLARIVHEVGRVAEGISEEETIMEGEIAPMDPRAVSARSRLWKNVNKMLERPGIAYIAEGFNGGELNAEAISKEIKAAINVPAIQEIQIGREKDYYITLRKIPSKSPATKAGTTQLTNLQRFNDVLKEIIINIPNLRQNALVLKKELAKISPEEFDSKLALWPESLRALNSLHTVLIRKEISESPLIKVMLDTVALCLQPAKSEAPHVRTTTESGPPKPIGGGSGLSTDRFMFTPESELSKPKKLRAAGELQLDFAKEESFSVRWSGGELKFFVTAIGPQYVNISVYRNSAMVGGMLIPRAKYGKAIMSYCLEGKDRIRIGASDASRGAGRVDLHIRAPKRYTIIRDNPGAESAASGTSEAAKSMDIVGKLSKTDDVDSLTWGEISDLLSRRADIECHEVETLISSFNAYFVTISSADIRLRFLIRRYGNEENYISVIKVDEKDNDFGKDKTVRWGPKDPTGSKIADRIEKLLTKLLIERPDTPPARPADAPQTQSGDAIGKFIEIESIRVDDHGELQGLIRNIDTGEWLDLATIRVFESSQVSHGPDFLKNVERLISDTTMKAEERDLLESIVQKFKKIPPKHIFVQYDKLRAGFFGVGKPDLIVTSDKYVSLPTFFLHEIIEYLKYKDTRLIHDIMMILDKDSISWFLRHKEKYERQGKGDYFTQNKEHYIIRAFIRQVFKEIDKKVSFSIKLDNKWAESLTEYLADKGTVAFPSGSSPAQSEFAKEYRSMATNSDKINFLLKHYPMSDVTIDVETVKAGLFTPKGTGRTDKVADKHYKITLFGLEGSYEECILFHEFMHIWLEEKGLTFKWVVKDKNTANYLFYIRNLVNDYIIEKENRNQFGNYYVDVTKELRDTDLVNQFNFVVGEKGANNMGIFILAITCKAIAGLYPELSETISAKVVGQVLQGDVFEKVLRVVGDISRDSSVEDYRACISKIHLLFTEDEPVFEGNSIIVNEGPVGEFTGVVDGLMSQIAQVNKIRRSMHSTRTDISRQSPWGGLDMRTLLEYVRDDKWEIVRIAELAKKNIEEGMMITDDFIGALRSMTRQEPQHADRCRELEEILVPAPSPARPAEAPQMAQALPAEIAAKAVECIRNKVSATDISLPTKVRIFYQATAGNQFDASEYGQPISFSSSEQVTVDEIENFLRQAMADKTIEDHKILLRDHIKGRYVIEIYLMIPASEYCGKISYKPMRQISIACDKTDDIVQPARPAETPNANAAAQLAKLKAAAQASAKEQAKVVPLAPADAAGGEDAAISRLKGVCGFSPVLKPEDKRYSRYNHVMRVVAAAKYIAQRLKKPVNIDKVEQIALYHDLGHASFAHMGERALRKAGFVFSEKDAMALAVKSLGVKLPADVVENLQNLPEKNPNLLIDESKVVLIADRLVGKLEDILFALESGVMEQSDIPGEILKAYAIDDVKNLAVTALHDFDNVMSGLVANFVNNGHLDLDHIAIEDGVLTDEDTYRAEFARPMIWQKIDQLVQTEVNVDRVIIAVLEGLKKEYASSGSKLTENEFILGKLISMTDKETIVFAETTLQANAAAKQADEDIEKSPIWKNVSEVLTNGNASQLDDIIEDGLYEVASHKNIEPLKDIYIAMARLTRATPRLQLTAIEACVNYFSGAQGIIEFMPDLDIDLTRDIIQHTINLMVQPLSLLNLEDREQMLKILNGAGAHLENQLETIPNLASGLSSTTLPELKPALDEVLKKLSDKDPEDVKATFNYVAGIYGTFKELLARTRQPEEPRYVFMPLPGALQGIASEADRIAMRTSIDRSLGEAREIAEDILKANGFTNVNIEFYDGTVEGLRNTISSMSAKKGNVNASNGLAYINKDELTKLTYEERKVLGVTTVRENIPKAGGVMTVAGHVALALGVLDLFNNDRAEDSDYWTYVLNLVRKISNNERKYEGITKDSFLETIKKGELEIDLPPIERERIDQNMRVLSVVEEAVGTSM